MPKPIQLALLLTLAIALTGCTSADLARSADRVDRGADALRDAATQVEDGRADHADLEAVLIEYLPERLRGPALEAVRIADDAPETSRQIATQMDLLADQWRAQADKNESETRNLITGGMELLAILLGAGGTGGIIGLVGGLIRGNRKGAETVAQAVQAAADRDEGFRNAIKSGPAGDSLRREIQKAPRSVQAAVHKHKV